MIYSFDEVTIIPASLPWLLTGINAVKSNHPEVKLRLTSRKYDEKGDDFHF